MMVSSAAKTVKQYIAELPDDRRREVVKVRKLIMDNIPKGFEEIMLYGMICYAVPLSRYPVTYNKQPLTIAGLASQKNYISLYLMGVYGDKKTEKWFSDEYKKSGKKMNMGKSCLRFLKADDLAMDVVAKVIEKVTVEDFIATYEKSRK